MHRSEIGLLENYNSLVDPHLSGFFSSRRQRRHLIKAGLISRTGEVRSEATYRLNVLREARAAKLASLEARMAGTAPGGMNTDVPWARALVPGIGMLYQGDSDQSDKPRSPVNERRLPRLFPFSSPERSFTVPPPPPLTSGGTPEDEEVGGFNARATTMPPVRPKSARVFMSQPESEGRRSDRWLIRGYREYSATWSRPPAWSARSRSCDRQLNESLRCEHDNERDSVPPVGSRWRDVSPFLWPLTLPPDVVPIAPSGGGGMRQRPHTAGQERRRITSAYNGKQRVHKGLELFDLQISGLRHPLRNEKTLSVVKLHYYGSRVRSTQTWGDFRDEVVIEQQHCGGNTVTVYKDRILPDDDLDFVSQRHRGYPFSLTFYINGRQHYRLSTCCECKFRPGVRLGGKTGFFGLVSVDNRAPCFRCEMKEQNANNESGDPGLRSRQQSAIRRKDDSRQLSYPLDKAFVNSYAKKDYPKSSAFDSTGYSEEPSIKTAAMDGETHPRPRSGAIRSKATIIPQESHFDYDEDDGFCRTAVETSKMKLENFDDDDDVVKVPKSSTLDDNQKSNKKVPEIISDATTIRPIAINKQKEGTSIAEDDKSAGIVKRENSAFRIYSTDKNTDELMRSSKHVEFDCAKSEAPDDEQTDSKDERNMKNADPDNLFSSDASVVVTHVNIPGDSARTEESMEEDDEEHSYLEHSVVSERMGALESLTSQPNASGDVFKVKLNVVVTKKPSTKVPSKHAVVSDLKPSEKKIPVTATRSIVPVKLKPIVTLTSRSLTADQSNKTSFSPSKENPTEATAVEAKSSRIIKVSDPETTSEKKNPAVPIKRTIPNQPIVKSEARDLHSEEIQPKVVKLQDKMLLSNRQPKPTTNPRPNVNEKQLSTVPIVVESKKVEKVVSSIQPVVIAASKHLIQRNITQKPTRLEDQNGLNQSQGKLSSSLVFSTTKQEELENGLVKEDQGNTVNYELSTQLPSQELPDDSVDMHNLPEAEGENNDSSNIDKDNMEEHLVADLAETNIESQPENSEPMQTQSVQYEDDFENEQEEKDLDQMDADKLAEYVARCGDDDENHQHQMDSEGGREEYQAEGNEPMLRSMNPDSSDYVRKMTEDDNLMAEQDNNTLENLKADEKHEESDTHLAIGSRASVSLYNRANEEAADDVIYDETGRKETAVDDDHSHVINQETYAVDSNRMDDEDHNYSDGDQLQQTDEKHSHSSERGTKDNGDEVYNDHFVSNNPNEKDDEQQNINELRENEAGKPETYDSISLKKPFEETTDLQSQQPSIGETSTLNTDLKTSQNEYSVNRSNSSMHESYHELPVTSESHDNPDVHKETDERTRAGSELDTSDQPSGLFARYSHDMHRSDSKTSLFKLDENRSATGSRHKMNESSDANGDVFENGNTAADGVNNFQLELTKNNIRPAETRPSFGSRLENGQPRTSSRKSVNFSSEEQQLPDADQTEDGASVFKPDTSNHQVTSSHYLTLEKEANNDDDERLDAIVTVKGDSLANDEEKNLTEGIVEQGSRADENADAHLDEITVQQDPIDDVTKGDSIDEEESPVSDAEEKLSAEGRIEEGPSANDNRENQSLLDKAEVDSIAESVELDCLKEHAEDIDQNEDHYIVEDHIKGVKDEIDGDEVEKNKMAEDFLNGTTSRQRAVSSARIRDKSTSKMSSHEHKYPHDASWPDETDNRLPETQGEGKEAVEEQLSAPEVHDGTGTVSRNHSSRNFRPDLGDKESSVKGKGSSLMSETEIVAAAMKKLEGTDFKYGGMTVISPDVSYNYEVKDIPASHEMQEADDRTEAKSASKTEYDWIEGEEQRKTDGLIDGSEVNHIEDDGTNTQHVRNDEYHRSPRDNVEPAHNHSDEVYEKEAEERAGSSITITKEEELPLISSHVNEYEEERTGSSRPMRHGAEGTHSRQSSAGRVHSERAEAASRNSMKYAKEDEEQLPNYVINADANRSGSKAGSRVESRTGSGAKSRQSLIQSAKQPSTTNSRLDCSEEHMQQSSRIGSRQAKYHEIDEPASSPIGNEKQMDTETDLDENGERTLELDPAVHYHTEEHPARSSERDADQAENEIISKLHEGQVTSVELGSRMGSRTGSRTGSRIRSSHEISDILKEDQLQTLCMDEPRSGSRKESRTGSRTKSRTGSGSAASKKIERQAASETTDEKLRTSSSFSMRHKAEEEVPTHGIDESGLRTETNILVVHSEEEPQLMNSRTEELESRSGSRARSSYSVKDKINEEHPSSHGLNDPGSKSASRRNSRAESNLVSQKLHEEPVIDDGIEESRERTGSRMGSRMESRTGSRTLSRTGSRTESSHHRSHQVEEQLMGDTKDETELKMEPNLAMNNSVEDPLSAIDKNDEPGSRIVSRTGSRLDSSHHRSRQLEEQLTSDLKDDAELNMESSIVMNYTVDEPPTTSYSSEEPRIGSRMHHKIEEELSLSHRLDEPGSRTASRAASGKESRTGSRTKSSSAISRKLQKKILMDDDIEEPRSRIGSRTGSRAGPREGLNRSLSEKIDDRLTSYDIDELKTSSSLAMNHNVEEPQVPDDQNEGLGSRIGSRIGSRMGSRICSSRARSQKVEGDTFPMEESYEAVEQKEAQNEEAADTAVEQYLERTGSRLSLSQRADQELDPDESKEDLGEVRTGSRLSLSRRADEAMDPDETKEDQAEIRIASRRSMKYDTNEPSPASDNLHEGYANTNMKTGSRQDTYQDDEDETIQNLRAESKEQMYRDAGPLPLKLTNEEEAETRTESRKFSHLETDEELPTERSDSKQAEARIRKSSAASYKADRGVSALSNRMTEDFLRVRSESRESLNDKEYPLQDATLEVADRYRTSSRLSAKMDFQMEDKPLPSNDTVEDPARITTGSNQSMYHNIAEQDLKSIMGSSASMRKQAEDLMSQSHKMSDREELLHRDTTSRQSNKNRVESPITHNSRAEEKMHYTGDIKETRNDQDPSGENEEMSRHEINLLEPTLSDDTAEQFEQRMMEDEILNRTTENPLISDMEDAGRKETDYGEDEPLVSGIAYGNLELTESNQETSAHIVDAEDDSAIEISRSEEERHAAMANNEASHTYVTWPHSPPHLPNNETIVEDKTEEHNQENDEEKLGYLQELDSAKNYHVDDNEVEADDTLTSRTEDDINDPTIGHRAEHIMEENPLVSYRTEEDPALIYQTEDSLALSYRSLRDQPMTLLPSIAEEKTVIDENGELHVLSPTIKEGLPLNDEIDQEQDYGETRKPMGVEAEESKNAENTLLVRQASAQGKEKPTVFHESEDEEVPDHYVAEELSKFDLHGEKRIEIANNDLGIAEHSGVDFKSKSDIKRSQSKDNHDKTSVDDDNAEMKNIGYADEPVLSQWDESQHPKFDEEKEEMSNKESAAINSNLVEEPDYNVKLKSPEVNEWQDNSLVDKFLPKSSELDDTVHENEPESDKYEIEEKFRPPSVGHLVNSDHEIQFGAMASDPGEFGTLRKSMSMDSLERDKELEPSKEHEPQREFKSDPDLMESDDANAEGGMKNSKSLEIQKWMDSISNHGNDSNYGIIHDSLEAGHRPMSQKEEAEQLANETGSPITGLENDKSSETVAISSDHQLVEPRLSSIPHVVEESTHVLNHVEDSGEQVLHRPQTNLSHKESEMVGWPPEVEYERNAQADVEAPDRANSRSMTASQDKKEPRNEEYNQENYRVQQENKDGEEHGHENVKTNFATEQKTIAAGAGQDPNGTLLNDNESHLNGQTNEHDEIGSALIEEGNYLNGTGNYLDGDASEQVNTSNEPPTQVEPTPVANSVNETSPGGSSNEKGNDISIKLNEGSKPLDFTELFDGTDVEISGTDLTKDQVRTISKKLKEKSDVTSLTLRSTGLNDDAVKQLADTFEPGSSLEYLNLNCNEMTSTGVPHVLAMLKNCPKIESLSLHENPLEDEGIGSLVSGLLKLSSPGGTADKIVVKTLDLGACDMTTAGAKHVALLLRSNTGLTHLSLTGNKGVGLAGWSAIGNALQANTQLATLELYHNALGDDGMAAIVDGLGANQMISFMDLEGNGLTDESGMKILKYFQSSPSLKRVNIGRGNKISEEVMEMIEAQHKKLGS